MIGQTMDMVFRDDKLACDVCKTYDAVCPLIKAGLDCKYIEAMAEADNAAYESEMEGLAKLRECEEDYLNFEDEGE